MGTEAQILLVDNDQESLINTAEILALNSCKVTTVASGINAMKTIQAGKKQFDMVIIDVDLPDVDSFQICRDIEKTGLLVVVTFTKEDSKLTYEALDSGALLLVKKPMDNLSTKYLQQFVVRQRILRSKMESYEQMVAVSHVQPSGIDFIESNNKDASWKNGTNEGGSDQLNQGNVLYDKQNLSVEPCYSGKFNKKKVSIEWTKKLHHKFMDAVTQLGEGNCYPKEILKVMDVPDLTRMQVASHLQKCRHDNWRSPTKRKNQSQRNKSSTLATGDEKESKKIKVFGAMPHKSQTKVHNNPPLISVPSFGNKIPKQLNTLDSRNGTPTSFNTPISCLLEKENVQERVTENFDLLKETSLLWTTHGVPIINPKSQPWSLPPPTCGFVTSIPSSKNSSTTCYDSIHVVDDDVAQTKGGMNENINSIPSLNNVVAGEFFIENEEMNFLTHDFSSFAWENKFENCDNHLGDESFPKDELPKNAMLATRVVKNL